MHLNWEIEKYFVLDGLKMKFETLNSNKTGIKKNGKSKKELLN